MKGFLKLGRYGLFLCIALSLIYLLAFYHKVFFNPNQYLFSNQGDGLKNYYNYAWHIKHDKSWLQLNGTAYPYGESLLMEDSLPLLSSAIKLIATVFPDITNYSIGILNFLLLFSLVVGTGFMFLIFKHYYIPPVISALASVAACFLSSQVLLLNPAGHFGLSFVCFFPMGWYLLIKYFDNPNKFRWSFLIGINIFIWTFIHVYLGFILLVFTIFTHIFKASFRWNEYKNLRKVVALMAQIIIPTAIIYTLIHFTDNHPNRVNMPFTTNYAASFYSVFTPVISPFKTLYTFIFGTPDYDSLSWDNIGNYIGITSNIALVCCIVYFIYFAFVRQLKKFSSLLNQDIFIYLMAVIVLLLYSMAVPLKYLPQNSTNIFPLINQFSAYGRLAWAFYNVIVVSSVLALYKIFYRKIYGKILFYILLSAYFIEGAAYHVKQSENITQAVNTFDNKNLSAEQKNTYNLGGHDFQAILPLPYYFIYNLPFETANSLNSIYSSMIASYQTGIPILSTYLSRPSLDESLKIMKQFMPQPYQEMLPKLVNDGRCIAVIIDNNDFQKLNNSENEILSKCKLIRKNADYSIYKLAIKDLTTNENNNKIELYNYIKQHYFPSGGAMIKDTSRFFIYQSFDRNQSSVIYRGTGAIEGRKTDYNLLLKTGTIKFNTTKTYILSFWYFCHFWDQTYNHVIISEKDSSGNMLQHITYSPTDASIINEWWYLSEFAFKVKSNKSILSVGFHGENIYEPWFVIDEFLLRPSDLDVYLLKNENGTKNVYLNNRQYFVSK